MGVNLVYDSSSTNLIINRFKGTVNSGGAGVTFNGTGVANLNYNIFKGGGNGNAMYLVNATGSTNITSYNNVWDNFTDGISWSTDVPITSKNNIYYNVTKIYNPSSTYTNLASDYNLGYGFMDWGKSYTTLSAWHTASGQDSHSVSANPLFVSASDYHLQSTSPAIDAGTDVSPLTTDYESNPIYGLPDVGAYEYQPPHDMGTNEVDISANVRVYGDGKFRNTETAGGITADFSVIPQSSQTTKWLDITKANDESSLIWEANHKKWKESSTTLGETDTLHTIGDLTIGKSYNLTIDGNPADEDPTAGNITSSDCIDSVCTANGFGKITFTYTGGYSEHTFDITDDISPTITITSPEEDADVSGDDTFDFTDSEETDPQCSLNDTDYESCDRNSTSFSQIPGWDAIEESDTFTLYLKDTDVSNNIGTTQRNFTKADTQAPVRSDKSPSGELSSNTTSTIISLKTDENATCKYDTSSKNYTDMDNTFDITGEKDHSKTLNSLTSGTSYSYYVRCQDESTDHNQNDTDYLISFSVANVAQDNEDQDDEVGNERDLNVNKVKATSDEDSITVTWKTDHNSKSSIRYGTDKSLKEKKKDNAKEKKHKVNLNNLLPDTLYYFRIKAEDGDNNTDKSRIHSIKTQPLQSPNSNSNENSNQYSPKNTIAPSYSGSASPNVCSYTVQAGDTLWNIAQQVYGNGSAYPLIIEKNKDLYPNIAFVLSVGQELTFDCNNSSEVKGASDVKEDKVQSEFETSTENKNPESKWWNPFSWF